MGACLFAVGLYVETKLTLCGRAQERSGFATSDLCGSSFVLCYSSSGIGLMHGDPVTRPCSCDSPCGLVLS